MAEKSNKEKQKAYEATKSAEKAVKKGPPQEERNELLVRIMGYDIPGSRNIYAGLTWIKGISWSVANVICLHLKLDKQRKMESFSKEELVKIENFIRDIKLPEYMKNRKYDPETGKSTHLLGSDLDIRREFDIKKMKEMRSYKGIRHAAKLPVRGQRTRSHFRSKGLAMGVKRKSK